MAEIKQKIDPQYLRNFVPISELTHDNLQELARSTVVEQLSTGDALFNKGDHDNRSFYVLTGEIELDSGDGQIKVISGGTVPSRFPLDHHRPRQATAKARTPVQYFHVDNNHMDLLLTWDQNASYMVSEIDETDTAIDEGDWMTHMLRSSIFHRIPASNIQAMFIKMEPKPVRAGNIVIRQGDDGDYYYYLKQGRAVVTRVTKTGQTIKLAELEPGSSFGEEALISNTKRNANVTMLSDGVLMCLAKADFASLLKEPVLQSVGYDEAQRMLAQGAILLDVRLDSEYKNSALPGSINIPLYLLRLKAPALDHSKKYVVYCDTGRRSSSAVFLLTERGFDAYVLDGGLMAIKSIAE